MSAGAEARIAPAQVQVHIGRLIVDDLGAGASDALVAGLASELGAVLARLLAGNVPRNGTSARKVAATVTLPARDGGGSAGEAGEPGRYGQAIGAALAGAVASQAVPSGIPAPGLPAPSAGRAR